MYTAIILALVVLSGYFAFQGLKHQKKGKIITAALIMVFTFVFFSFLDFWVEQLWFDATGYAERFWKIIWWEIGLGVAGFILGALIVYILTFSLTARSFRLFGAALSGIYGAVLFSSSWETVLKFLNSVETGISDPILGMDGGFYLFILPFYQLLYNFVIFSVIIAFISNFIGLYINISQNRVQLEPQHERFVTKRSFYISSGLVLILLGVGKFLGRYELLNSEWGIVHGPGWTDDNIRMPAYLIVSVITLFLGIALMIPAAREGIKNRLGKFKLRRSFLDVYMIVIFAVFTGFTWFILLTAIPGLFQKLKVEPNEISLERPYIAYNIEFTKYGFGLDKLEEKEYEADRALGPGFYEDNQSIFKNIRLWDWRALDAVYKQFQEIRLYYEFEDVDIDRYTYGGNYRQVMVSAREMEQANLPPQSQTFINRRFKYTHGFGATLTNVSEFTSNGLPNLLVKNIPPVSEYPELEITQPRIYYGELTRQHVIVNSAEKEFDYPKGEENVYYSYEGEGGVYLNNLWRKFLFGWKFDGTKLFFSGYPTDSSKILFHRQIKERVNELAPFLEFDDDPYVVIGEGRLYWIIDSYTTSEEYPFSEPFSGVETIEYNEGEERRALKINHSQYLHGINYIRNSVKTVVDAFNGKVTFYIYDEEDPLIQVWDKIFPGMFKAKEEMPEYLRDNVRYPIDLLLTQGLMYAKYHMNDPTVFYNQEDLWIRATEKYYNEVQPVEPYYVMWERPGKDEQEFVLILPFTPKNRQVLIGWIAGMCDNENYGRFLAYKFPKEKRILGPQQVETKIDQDSFLSGQLTLWDQRGSNVIRGNVLAIPLEETLLYVEPIYLQAETAAYPELRLVVVMHNDNMSYAPTFEEAMSGLLEGTGRRITETETSEQTGAGEDVNTLIKQANEAFDSYIQRQSQGNFRGAGESLEELQNLLNELNNRINLNNAGDNGKAQ